MHRLDLFTSGRYSVLSGPEVDLTRRYQQYSEETWIEQPGIKGNGRFKPFGGLKPSGLWYSFGRLWIDFHPSFKKFADDTYMPPVVSLIVDQTKIFKVDNQQSIIDLNETFKSLRGNGHINWEKLARFYDGIEVSDYDKKKSDLSWYRSFDVSSGCIWSLKEIKHVSRVRLVNEVQNYFDNIYNNK